MDLATGTKRHRVDGASERGLLDAEKEDIACHSETPSAPTGPSSSSSNQSNSDFGSQSPQSPHSQSSNGDSIGTSASLPNSPLSDVKCTRVISKDRLYCESLVGVTNSIIATMHKLNNDRISCGRCWLTLEHCCCANMVNMSCSLSSVADVVVYTHPRELVSMRGSNTGKLLVLQGAVRAVFGCETDETWLLDQVLRCPSRTCVLFPSQDSLTVHEYLAILGATSAELAAAADEGEREQAKDKATIERMGKGEEKSSRTTDALTDIRDDLKSRSIVSGCGDMLPFFEPSSSLSFSQRPLVILLDATWNLARTLNRRLDLLLQVRGVAADTLRRVRLSTALRNTIGGSRGNRDKGGVIMERVNTMHAFIALLEELFGLAETGEGTTHVVASTTTAAAAAEADVGVDADAHGEKPMTTSTASTSAYTGSAG